MFRRGCSECFVAQRNANLIIIHPRSSKQVGRVIATAPLLLFVCYTKVLQVVFSAAF
jgi:ABC-type enterochelin transport system substrate-binding protein